MILTNRVSASPPRQSKLKVPATSAKAVNTGVAKLSIQEPVRVKSKNLDVAAEYKKTKRKNAANFVVIGKISRF